MIKKIKELSKIFNEDYFQKLNIYNKDGGKAKMCGNGLKIVAYFHLGH